LLVFLQVGSNVRDYPELALQAWKRGDHLAVHTWSHAHLTTLSDFEILGELGWTIQIIHDLTGLVPLYYRPPYGDVDNRVRALAKVCPAAKQSTFTPVACEISPERTLIA
jgi:peptidoglycan/xylan/chitin deacetylase (PgdA/CDA1 family)